MNKVDELVLLPIYPARELPMEGVNSEMILERMRPMPKQVLSKQIATKPSNIKVIVTGGYGAPVAAEIEGATSSASAIMDGVRRMVLGG